MNRNVLKIIAFVTMIIDHIGAIFFPEVAIFRIIGRISFPIFCFFIAEGFFYTKSRKNYVFTLIICLIVSWVPFCLALDNSFYTANVIGCFLLSLVGMYLVDLFVKNKTNWCVRISTTVLYLIIVLILWLLMIVPEGVLGVLLPVVFYVFRKNKRWQLISASIVLVLYSSLHLLNGYNSIFDIIQFFSLFAILILAFYNGEKGKLNLKYMFYVGYPMHFIILYMINLIL